MDESKPTGHVYPFGYSPFRAITPNDFAVGIDESAFRERNALLVKALRSGEFVQGLKTLQTVVREAGKLLPTARRQCCLGVACYVAQYHGVPVYMREMSETTVFAIVNGGNESDGSTNTAPDAVRDWFGWQENNPELWTDEGSEVSAATLNDGGAYRGPKSFGVIADAFERTFVTFTNDEPSTVEL